jgi:aspartate racemase
VHELVAAQSQLTPATVAVEFEDEALTYAELNARANQLAHYLRSCGVGPDVLVGLCLEPSLELVIGLLGVLKAGGAYVPLDPAYPKERLSLMLADSQAPVIVTQERYTDLTDESRIVCLDRDWSLITHESASEFDSGVSPDNLAYVMYTSGSTGIPKGVSINHRAIVRLVKEPNYVELNSAHTFLQLAPISFDASTFEIWGSLLNGARLAVMRGGTPSLQELGVALRRHRVTTLWLTAGLFNLMVDQQLEDLQQLKQLLAGGDVLSVAHVRRFLQNAPGCKLINGYGPTENTTFTCCHPMTEFAAIDGTVPIGRPITNTRVYVLDGELQPVPLGAIGELYTSGDGLARGYFTRASLTAERFIPNPFSPGERLYKTGDQVRHLTGGQVDFIGRLDDQVKIRGYRIEPAEIEAMLAQHAGVRQCKVLVQEVTPADKRLIAYVVCDETETAQLRGFLKERLPNYMIPAAFVTLAQMPLTANGKVDRKALPKLELSREQSEQPLVLPRTPTEQQLAEMWSELLGLNQVSIHDNFFDLGGHSLLLTQLASRMRNTLNVDVPLRSLFEAPTILEMGQMLSNLQVAQHDPAELAQLLGEIKNLTPQEIQAQLIELN